ncbi:MAG: phosphotransferase [Terriglobia bacterium]
MLPLTRAGVKASGLSATAVVEDLQCRVASAMNIDPELVSIEGHSSHFPWVMLWCWGKAAGARLFAKILLADPYPVPPRFATPWEELEGPESPQRPVEEQVSAEWNMIHEMRSLVGAQNIPAPLGRSFEDRTLVVEEVSGRRMDSFVNWSWPSRRKAHAAEAAMLQAGSWLRTVHESSLRGYETVDVSEAVDALLALARRRSAEFAPYARLAHQVLESARRDLNPRTSLRVPVALNHGDFSLPNLIWDDPRKRLWVIDFEHSSPRPIIHDLCTLIATLRYRLLMPFTAPRVVWHLEEAFWKGYGPTAKEIRTLVSGLSCAWLFYHIFPRLSTLRERRGWKGGVKALLYKSLFQRFMIARILRAQRS